MTEIKKLFPKLAKEGRELSKQLRDGLLSEKEASIKVKRYSKAVRMFGKYMDASIKGDKNKAKKEYSGENHVR